MAKGKHSVALFEVIQKDKRFARKSAPSPLKTPAWWFKSQEKSAAASQAIAVQRGARVDRDIVASRASALDRSVAVNRSATISNLPVTRTANDAAIDADSSNSAIDAYDESADENASIHFVPRQPVEPAAIPRQRQSILPARENFQSRENLSAREYIQPRENAYVRENAQPRPAAQHREPFQSRELAQRDHAGHAHHGPLDNLLAAGKNYFEKWRPYFSRASGSIVGIATALVVIGGISLVRHFTPRPAGAQTIYTLDGAKHVDIHPSVLDLSGSSRSASERSGGAASSGASATNTASARTPLPTPAEVIPAGDTRQKDVNYVVIQSYGDETRATDAANFLNNHGIACTVEHGIKGWANLYCVVSLQGFTRVSGAEYAAYRKKIEDLNPEFAGTKKYNRFEPQAFKWDRAS
jgi:hypothetical protein